MDDSYEQPSTVPVKAPEDQTEDEQSSGDEDGGLDWTKLQSIARPVIPKRGEKDFEPKPGGGSGLQVHVLDRARSAMFDALRATRTISSKAVSHAVWYPDIRRVHVTLARGIHFSTMGHSAPRPVVSEDGVEKVQKRLELLPEETIYLVERGSLFCWKDTDLNFGVSGMEEMAGAPMTVQQVYTEMIGVEDLTLEKFQVFSYLKRLGYSVTRTNPPSSYYPVPTPRATTVDASVTHSILYKLFCIFPLMKSKLSRLLFGTFDWWRPLRISRWLHHDKNYGSLFRSLRFMSAGHKIPLHHPDPERRQEEKRASPYQIFYNLYKPSTPIKKSAPPQPDFQIVVINARTTPMPTLQELTDLFDILPELPPPLPRQRHNQVLQSAAPSIAVSQPTTQPPIIQSSVIPHTPTQSLISRLFPWAFRQQFQSTRSVRRPHPFMALKAGKKLVVIAVVDAGNISFFRVGQGDFTEWPMV